jgi:hypothetical protein
VGKNIVNYSAKEDSLHYATLPKNTLGRFSRRLRRFFGACARQYGKQRFLVYVELRKPVAEHRSFRRWFYLRHFHRERNGIKRNSAVLK